jgi:phosphoenolpyruvate phosphomutase
VVEDSLSSHRSGESGLKVSRFAALRRLLESRDLTFLIEAHSGLSAKIVEKAGFLGIWASGLSISAMLGVRDNNEASWTQVLDVLEFMADATRVPILADSDTGYGNFNNVRRLVRKLCQRDIAGICIEDKLFPKSNSFVSERQPLADVDEFCGRIKAGKDSQTDNDFSIVARTEALVSGHSLDEALRRAESYHAAGADAVLVHSKQSSATEILAFMERWDKRCPVVIVPTTYHATPTEVFRRAGISTVIWANHLVRASITAMQETAQQIFADQSLHEVEGRVAPLHEIFGLVGNQELEDAARRYLPVRNAVRGIVLAASRGDGLHALTRDQPKCMIDIRGQPLLRRLVDTLWDCGVRHVTVVRGYHKEAIALRDVYMVDNDEYETTGEVASLVAAYDQLDGEAVVVYGDVLFRRYILDGLLTTPGDIVIAVDALWKHNGGHQADGYDLVVTDRDFSGHYLEDSSVTLRSIGNAIDPTDVCGEWIGLLRMTAKGARQVREELDRMVADGSWASANMSMLIARLAARYTIGVHYITSHWLDVDTVLDLADARNFS